MAIHLKRQNITHMYTPIELVTTALQHVHGGGGGGGVTDHGYLQGLADNDHPQYLLTSNTSAFVQSSVMNNYQLTINNSLSLGINASNSFIHTSNSSDFIANSNSIVFALTDHTHEASDFGFAVSDHSHGSINVVTIAGSNLTLASASSGLTVGVPNYITTAYGAALQGSGSYTQNTGTIQFANSNGLTFGLSENGVMTAQMEYPDQVGILGIWDGISSIQTNSSMQFADANGISFRFNGSTMTASYTVPLVTVFSNSNNVEFGLAGRTITALANFSQSLQTESPLYVNIGGNTSGTTANISSGTMLLYGGSNITLNQDSNSITLLGGGLNVSLGPNNTLGTLTRVSSGTLNLHAGNNITFSQNGNNVTVIGPAQGGVQTAISAIGVLGSLFTSGTVYLSAQNNITIGTFATSNSQYIRLSIGNYLTTAANSTHTHGSNVSTVSTSGTNIVLSSASNGLTMRVPNYITTATGGGVGTGFTSVSTSGTDIFGTLSTNGLRLGIPKYITTAALSTHTHGSVNLTVSLLTASVSSASNGVSLGITGPVVSNLVNSSQVGTLYFSNVPGFSWSSSVSGVNTSVYIVT